ncbi:hypothetical protein MATL_G00183660 [Megalops atlanticus]|uniref:Coiled-coil domain containing 148 n=1 Tax=Megalops atlanticus TaxID=7932 RepID=A0A9D3T7H0_MEGAT|nr:hypothetical protein MATL_G00183660 [Megalops atlanticus]
MYIRRALTVFQIKRVLHVAQRTRESTLLRLHRQAWSQEQSRLIKAGEKVEAELLSFLIQNAVGLDFTSHMQEYELSLEKERERFRVATVTPIWQLREDLQCRLSEVASQQCPLPSRPPDWDRVLQEVSSVKDQQEAVQQTLQSECQSVEQEISAMGLEECLSSTQGIVGDLGQVPEEVLRAKCPYPDLKASLLHEFNTLNEKYGSRLQSIRDRLQGVGRCCGWPEEEHMVFQMIVSQYPGDLNNHRTLYTDMLLRLLPHRTKQELTEHERAWDWHRFTLAQQQALIQSWRRDQASLLAKVLSVLQEARVAHQEELMARSERRHQQEISAQLKEKLHQWHAQQEEVARLEEAMATRRREEEEERLRRKQERDEARRTLQKERVKQFHSEKQRKREELQRRDQQRLEELRTLMAEQARRDKERVQFREVLLQQHREEREARALLKLKEEKEREGRLEALRNQVAVEAEADPERMMGETKAWRSRQRAGEEFVLQKPLHLLYTFTDRQIVSDPRVRIEQALREAGLHDTLYAQAVLSSVRPPRRPRRDTESTVFKS